MAEVDEKSDPAYGLTVGTQFIQAHPDLDMIIGIDATAGAATARALKETGKAGKIKVGAMDRDDDMLPYIKDGTIEYTLAQNSVMEEWVALHYLYWLKHNSIPAFKDWRKVDAPQCPVDYRYGCNGCYQGQRGVFLPPEIDEIQTHPSGEMLP